MMGKKRRSFTGLLQKPISPGNAVPRGLKRAFALPADDNDRDAYVRGECRNRLRELDRQIGVRSDVANIWECRSKALVERVFGVKRNPEDWWERLGVSLAIEYVRGFKIASKKKGRPREWSNEQLACLFADVEFLKRKTWLSVSRICDTLPKKAGYEKRWANYSGSALRKYYLAAKRRRSDVLFELMLCGPNALLSPDDDLIGTAIKLYALKK
jgi:hypothetical protein